MVDETYSRSRLREKIQQYKVSSLILFLWRYIQFQKNTSFNKISMQKDNPKHLFANYLKQKTIIKNSFRYCPHNVSQLLVSIYTIYSPV